MGIYESVKDVLEEELVFLDPDERSDLVFYLHDLLESKKEKMEDPVYQTWLKAQLVKRNFRQHSARYIS